jgi:hypothetical protein
MAAKFGISIWRKENYLHETLSKNNTDHGRSAGRDCVHNSVTAEGIRVIIDGLSGTLDAIEWEIVGCREEEGRADSE